MARNTEMSLTGIKPSRVSTITKTINGFDTPLVEVAFVPLTESVKRRSFRQLDPDTHTPLKQVMVNEQGDVVPSMEITKGLEDSAGRWQIFTDSEIEALKLKSNKRLQVLRQVDVSEIDPIYFDGAPQAVFPTTEARSVAANYVLLAEALGADTGLIVETIEYGTVKTYLLRNHPELGHLVAQALLPNHLLRYGQSDTIASKIKALPHPDKTQVAEARKLLLGDVPKGFDLTEVEDPYGLAMEAALEAKAAGDPIPAPVVVADVEAPADLMAALRASAEATKKAAPAPTKKSRVKAKA